MTPDEKRKVVGVIDKHNGNFSVECLSELVSECSIHKKDLQNIRVCWELSKEHPEHLDMGVPTEEFAVHVEREDLVQAMKSVKDVNHGLSNFLLKPAGMSGMELFKHMIDFRKRDPRLSGSKDSCLKVSCCLDVEATNENQQVLGFTMEDVRK